MWRRALPLVLLAACGESSDPTATADIDLGVVPLGGTASARRPLPFTDGLEIHTDHPDLTLTRTDQGRLLEVTYRPSTLEPLETTVELVGEAGAAQWHVTGTPRLPDTVVAPSELELGPEGFADLWAWPEPGLDVELADDALPACPGAPCVERLRDADARGLPATLRVHGPLEAPTTITVSTCPLPACQVEVPVRPAPACGPLVFDAAPVGQPSLRNLTCPDGEAHVEDPALEIVASSTTAVTVAWTPSVPGPFEAELRRGDAVVPIRGYAVEAPPCRAEVAPSTIGFGAVGVGGFVARAAQVENLGLEPCLWSGAATEGAAFSISSPAPRWLEAGERLDLDVRYAPRRRAPEAGRAHLWVADAAEGGHVIELAGRGVAADLELLTEAAEFGTIATCSDTRTSVWILNRGHAPGQVLRAEVTGPSAPHVSVRAPERIMPGTSAALTVVASVQGTERIWATLELTLEDAAGVRDHEIPIRGQLDLDLARVVDTYVQIGPPHVDIVFVIDPMGPNSPALVPLAANLQAFIQFVLARALRAHVAVVSARTSSTAIDGFEPYPGTDHYVFSPNDVDLEWEFTRTALHVASRSPGPNRAIGRIHEAVTSSAAAEVVRPDAVLSLISIALTEDGTEGAVQTWLNRMSLIKGFRHTHLFTFSSIVGDDPGGCEGTLVSAEAAPRHIMMANHSGGVFQSVCTLDWSRSLEDLSTTAFGFKSRFFLSQQPIISTLEVSVEGEDVPAIDPRGIVNWTYDFSTNSINFSPFSNPLPDARIEIRYQVPCP